MKYYRGIFWGRISCDLRPFSTKKGCSAAQPRLWRVLRLQCVYGRIHDLVPSRFVVIFIKTINLTSHSSRSGSLQPRSAHLSSLLLHQLTQFRPRQQVSALLHTLLHSFLLLHHTPQPASGRPGPISAGFDARK